MTDGKEDHIKLERPRWILAFVNVAIWAIAIIALAFVINRGSGARGLFPILAGGSAVAIALLSTLRRE